MFLEFFDEIYVLNLPGREDRREIMASQLHRFGVPYKLFSATKHSDGAMGLVETMKRVFAEALSMRYENVLILEDDAEFLLPPIPFLKHVLPQLPKDYDLFYFGMNILTQPERLSENILKIGQCYATHAVSYSRKAMEKILLGLLAIPEGVRRPYDMFLREQIQVNSNVYGTYPMLATQMDSFSDIENVVPPWKKIMADSFTRHTRNLKTMSTEIVYCAYHHQINNIIPVVDEDKFEPQNLDLMGKTCDCGRFVYHEEKCPTCSGDKWRIVWKEK